MNSTYFQISPLWQFSSVVKSFLHVVCYFYFKIFLIWICNWIINNNLRVVDFFNFVALKFFLDLKGGRCDAFGQLIMARGRRRLEEWGRWEWVRDALTSFSHSLSCPHSSTRLRLCLVTTLRRVESNYHIYSFIVVPSKRNCY